MAQGIESLNFIIAAVVVFLGLYTVLTRTNLLKVVIGLELMSKGAALAFIASEFTNADGDVFQGSQMSQSLVILIIGFEVIVTALALAIIVSVYRHYGTLDAGKINRLRG